jgi:hypothetical protein
MTDGTPSVTTWTRLEPQHRDADLRVGAAARIADPAWLLARQWHFGEFHASDGGSPAAARLHLQTGTLSGYRGRGEAADPNRWQAFPQATPLEVIVEREPAGYIDLTLRADGGRRFLRLLSQHGASAYRAVFVAVYPLPAGLTDAATSVDSAAHLAVLAGRVPDALALAAVFDPSGTGTAALPEVPAVAPADQPAVLGAATAFLAWWRRLVGWAQPGAQAWDPTRLEHTFELSTRLGEGEASQPVKLTGAGYPGGALDWHDLDIAANITTVPDDPPGADVVRTVLPTPVRFPGMPASRWWEFEDARVHLGGIEAGATDLGRMLLAEFGTLYSGDWFVIPIELAVGTVARVASLVVTDTFGVSTLVGPAAHGDWDMFRVRGTQRGPDAEALFVLPPALPHCLTGEPVEEVVLLRDEGANLAWAVECRVPSAAGQPVNRHEQYLASLRGAPDERPTTGAPASASFDYRLRSPLPPEHWVPLVPEAHKTGLRLRRDAPIRPLGTVLDTMAWLAAEELPREGLRVIRQWRYARWSDGSTHLWRARQRSAGRGEASSGLGYDLLNRVADE